MTLRFLLDTNILSEIVCPAPDRRVLQRLSLHADECALCSVTWHELLYGLARMPDRARRAAAAEFVLHVVPQHFPLLS